MWPRPPAAFPPPEAQAEEERRAIREAGFVGEDGGRQGPVYNGLGSESGHSLAEGQVPRLEGC